MIDENLSTADEIKQLEKEIRNEVQDALTTAKAGAPLSSEWLSKEIYCTPDGKDEVQNFIRMPDYTKSIRNNV